MKIEKTLSPTGVKSVVLVNEKYEIIEEVTLFLSHLEQKGKSLGTVESYCRDLKVFFTWLDKEGIKFYEMRPRKMFSFVKYLDTEVGHGNKKSPSTLNRYLSTISAFYSFYETMQGYQEFVQDMFIMKENNNNVFRQTVYNHKLNSKQVNVSQFRRSKVNSDRVKRLFSNQIQSLYSSLDLDDPWGISIRNKLLFRIMYETGMRVGETLGLRFDDISEVDPTENYGYISVTRRKETELYHKDHRIKTLEREIPVSMELILTIDEYICEYRPESDYDSIFLNHRGRTRGSYMTKGIVEDIFQDISDNTGIKCTPHILRHTHATELAEAGYNQLYIKHRLGHKSIQSTDKYQHPSLASQTEAYSRFLNNRKSVILGGDNY